MTTSPELDFASVVIAPGDTETTSLTVRYDSEIVEAYTFEVRGLRSSRSGSRCIPAHRGRSPCG